MSSTDTYGEGTPQLNLGPAPEPRRFPAGCIRALSQNGSAPVSCAKTPSVALYAAYHCSPWKSLIGGLAAFKGYGSMMTLVSSSPVTGCPSSNGHCRDR